MINGTKISTIAYYFIALLALVISLAIGGKYYKVWAMEMNGKAALAEASQSRMIQVEQAKGELEAATSIAAAIAVVGEAATKYPAYRQQQFIQAFGEAIKSDSIQQIIYVPTEGNIPLVREIGGQ